MKFSANTKSLLPVDVLDSTELLPNVVSTTAGTGPSTRTSINNSIKPTPPRTRPSKALPRPGSSSSRSSYNPKLSFQQSASKTVSSSPRIVFGRGVLARLPAELGRLHLSAPLIVSSPSRADLMVRVQTYIPNLDYRVLEPSVIQYHPAHDMEMGSATSDYADRDCVISVGGGSAVATARAIGMRNAIPHICIPTTYSGNELRMAMPSCAAETQTRRRRARRELLDSRAPNFKPVVIIYDEDLTMSTPKIISAPSGSAANAIAHTSESSHQTKDANSLWSYLHLPGV